MKIPALALVIAVSTASLSFGQSAASDKKPQDEATVQAITNLEHEWAAALMKGDVAAFDRIESPDYMLSDPDGNIENRAESDADFTSGSAKYTAFSLDEMKVRVFGDTAIVFGLETEKSSFKGQDTSGQFRFTDVFVKQNGSWAAVSTHVSRVAKH